LKEAEKKIGDRSKVTKKRQTGGSKREVGRLEKGVVQHSTLTEKKNQFAKLGGVLKERGREKNLREVGTKKESHWRKKTIRKGEI